MMEVFSLSSTHYPHPPPFPSRKPHSTTSLSFSLKPPSESDNQTSSSPFTGHLRRPKTLKPPSPSFITPTTPSPKFNNNPLKNLVNPSPTPSPPPLSDTLSAKLWLSNKLSPPPPPPPPPPPLPKKTPIENEPTVSDNSDSDETPPSVEFRQEGKIFVGNLPVWIKKHEVAEFFRQFGPIKNVILIKRHNDTERNAGFGFVTYGGPTAEKSAMKAVEFDGIEFHGRVLTVKLDDGRKLKARWEERVRWVEGWSDRLEHRSKWHEERDNSRKDFRRVVETEPENWQAVIRAFQSITKPSRREFGLMVNYYARRGDMHRAREAFESMRARGIEPTSHVYTK